MTTPNNPYQPQQPYSTENGTGTTPTYGTPSPYAPAYESTGLPGVGNATPAYGTESTFQTPAPTERATFGTEASYGTEDSSAADKAKAAADEAKGVAQQAGDKAKDLAGTAAGEAADVKDHALSVGGDVVDTAKDQIAQVAGEAKQQGQQILDEGLSQLRQQVDQGQGKLAEIVRGLTGEVEGLLNGQPQQGGTIHSLVGNAQGLGDKLAATLEDKDFEDIVDDVRRYAARKPMTFLAISAGLGFAASRLVRGLQGAASDEADQRQVTQRRLAQYPQGTYQRPTARAEVVDPQQNLVTGQYTAGYEEPAAIPNQPLDGLR